MVRLFRTMKELFLAAGADPEIRATVRQKFGDLVIEVAEPGGVEPGGAWAFFADGMLLNIVAALELHGVGPPRGGGVLSGSGTEVSHAATLACCVREVAHRHAPPSS